MSTVRISPKKIEATIYAPPSKSMAQRLLLAAWIHKGTFKIDNLGTDEDTRQLLGVLRNLGVQVNEENDATVIHVSEDWTIPQIIQLGESGLAARMLIPIMACLGQTIQFVGSGTLMRRSMTFLTQELPKLGVQVESHEDKLPITISGKLLPQSITIHAHDSSQYISGLIYAYTLLNARNVSITIIDMVSTDYIDMSIATLESYGWQHISRNGNIISFSDKPKKNPSAKHSVEGDWSNAAMWMIAGAIAGSVTVKGLDVFTTQGDKKILEALQDVGCYLSISTERIQVKQHELRPFFFDATDTPDLIPPLVALAASIPGISVVRGSNRLLNKESNRAVALIEEFAKLGVRIVQQDNELVVYGIGKLQANEVSSHHDHRIAMSLGIAALNGDGTTMINDADSVAKSYPNFWEELSRC